jgi:hypothetical protein
MISLKQLILESLSLYKCEVLIKTSKEINKIEIYNRIRALTGVVVVTVEQNTFLQSKSNEHTEYSLLHIKYVVGNDATESINNIKVLALQNNKIPGLLQFIPRTKTIMKKGQY